MNLPKPLKYILAVLFGLLFIYFATCTIEKTDSEGNKKWQKILAHYADSVDKSYRGIILKAQQDSAQRASTIVALRDSVNSFKQQINENDDEATQSQVQTGVKIKYVNSLSDDSLTALFISSVLQGYHEE